MHRTPFHDSPWELPQFAYGVNTNIDNLRARCPEWTGGYEPATLSGYRMRFNKAYPGASTTYCNIQQHPGSTVYGVLLWLDEASFRRVDRFEGFPIHYHRELVTVTDSQDVGVMAWAYASDHTDDTLRPCDSYLEAVLAGLLLREAPDAYLEEVVGAIPPRRRTRAATGARR